MSDTARWAIENRDAISRAWAEVPEEYVPDDDHDHDLAVVIAAMARDLRARSFNWQQIAESRSNDADDAYRRGRVELAEELATLVGEYQPSKGAWHYVMGCLDIVIGKVEVLR